MSLKKYGKQCTFYGFSISIYRWNPGVAVNCHILLPEFESVVYPTLGNSAFTEAETMPQAIVDVKLSRNSHCGKTLQPTLHCLPRGYTIVRADTDVCRSIILRG